MLLNFDAKHMRFTYQAPFEGPEAEAAKSRTAIEGQAVFEDLPDDGETLPF